MRTPKKKDAHGSDGNQSPEPWIMHYVVQSLANEVPALFLPSAIFGHIRSQTTMEYYCESLEMNSEGRIIEVVLGTEFSG